MEFTPAWEYVSDTVMGGVSSGAIKTEVVAGRVATRLAGQVSLENNGGFIQMACDLDADARPFDASAWSGFEVDIVGNDESYELRLRTSQLTRPWQSYRASFLAPEKWTTVRVPFVDFKPHGTEIDFDPAVIRRIGILAIGRVFKADISVSAVRLFCS
jgi:hypothetical protein